MSFQDIDEGTIVIDPVNCRYIYDEIEISSGFTIKLDDLSQAGLSVAPTDDPSRLIRLYRLSSFSEQRFQRLNYKTMKWSKKYELAKSPGQ